MQNMANAIRALSMDAVEKAKSGHPGMPMGMADVATVLFTKFLKFDAAHPTWPDRDRFILSAGHGSMLQYALLYLTGYKKVTLDEIKNFRQLGALTAGHPEIDHEAGIEMTTGPLGQGIATATGFALAERHLNAKFGNDLVDHHTYVIASDGDLMEGISHESCSLAGHLKLSKLIVLYDDNSISIDGDTDKSFTDDTAKRFEAYGWDVQRIDGHDMVAIEGAIATAKQQDKPSLIACKTRIGFGAPTKENKASSHGAPLGEDEIAGARTNLNWPHAPFEIPDDILQEWRMVGQRSGDVYKAWSQNVTPEFEDALGDLVPDSAIAALKEAKQYFLDEKPKLATRQTSGKVLEMVVPVCPSMIGGSADLTGSNNTKVNDDILNADNYGGQYIHYGVREHGMAAAMNGMAIHGSIIPYSGTFLSFADYCRPSIRLAALMGVGSIFVMTHDSIGLGEDGPTHQPVEHLASLRAMPNVNVFRPCDGIETAECWELALQLRGTPSVMALTRQGLPTLRDDIEANKSARGAYILMENSDTPDITLFASGSEVYLAVEAYQKLVDDGKKMRVVSVPCMDLFWQQDGAYIQALICNDSKKIAIEAACRQGWDGIIGGHGTFIGMNGFGESAPAPQLYEHFGITVENILEKAGA